MSKNIVIQEGGTGKQLTVDKLKTDIVGGGTCLWVPEDTTQLGTKHISENGTYRASNDGYYGYSEVTVSGIGSVTGRDPETGEDVAVSTDPETGEIVTTVLPTEIRVIEPPTNPYGVYVDGQTITKDGMVVKAYSAKGEEMQVVPIGEITINPTTASMDETTGVQITTSEDFTNIQPWPNRINAAMGGMSTTTIDGRYKYELSGAYCTFLIGNGGSIPMIASSRAGDNGLLTETMVGQETGRTHTISLNRYFTHNGKTVYYGTNYGGNYTLKATGATNQWGAGAPSDAQNGPAAWVIVYGDIEQPANSQTITVSWPRPRDGKILETSFDILVGPTPNSGDD